MKENDNKSFLQKIESQQVLNENLQLNVDEFCREKERSSVEEYSFIELKKEFDLLLEKLKISDEDNKSKDEKILKISSEKEENDRIDLSEKGDIMETMKDEIDVLINEKKTLVAKFEKEKLETDKYACQVEENDKVIEKLNLIINDTKLEFEKNEEMLRTELKNLEGRSQERAEEYSVLKSHCILLQETIDSCESKILDLNSRIDEKNLDLNSRIEEVRELREKEVELREKEVELREKEVELREKVKELEEGREELQGVIKLMEEKDEKRIEEEEERRREDIEKVKIEKDESLCAGEDNGEEGGDKGAGNNYVEIKKNVIVSSDDGKVDYSDENITQISPISTGEIVVAEYKEINTDLVYSFSLQTKITDLEIIISNLQQELKTLQDNEKINEIKCNDQINELNQIIEDKKQENSILESDFDIEIKSLQKKIKEIEAILFLNEKDIDEFKNDIEFLTSENLKFKNNEIELIEIKEKLSEKEIEIAVMTETINNSKILGENVKSDAVHEEHFSPVTQEHSQEYSLALALELTEKENKMKKLSLDFENLKNEKKLEIEELERSRNELLILANLINDKNKEISDKNNEISDLSGVKVELENSSKLQNKLELDIIELSKLIEEKDIMIIDMKNNLRSEELRILDLESIISTLKYSEKNSLDELERLQVRKEIKNKL